MNHRADAEPLGRGSPAETARAAPPPVARASSEPAPPRRGTGTVEVALRCRFELSVELRLEDGAGEPLAWLPANEDLADVADQTFTAGVLCDRLPADARRVTIDVEPVFADGPWVRTLAVTVTADDGSRYEQSFPVGRWTRRAAATAPPASGDRGPLRARLCALPASVADRPAPHLDSPVLTCTTLSALGVRALGDEPLEPDRPVLVCARAVEEIVAATEAAGTKEIGGCMLGVLLRLPEPLPGTTTRIVTVLTACIGDDRHAGSFARLQFDPAAMAAAAEVAELRGRGERVLTAFHSHGWNLDCRRCNESTECTLPSAEAVSLDDYQVLEAMFPSKTTLLPIAGRRLGARPGRPAFVVHAWRSGCVRPIAWRSYRD